MNDIVGWVGLVLAVLGFPLIYNRLRDLWKRFQRYRTGGSRAIEPVFMAEWNDGPRSTVSLTNMTGRTVHQIHARWSSRAMEEWVDLRAVRPGRSFVVHPHAELGPDSYLWLDFRVHGVPREARWWQFWWWAPAKSGETIPFTCIREDSEAAYRARFAIAEKLYILGPRMMGWEDVQRTFDARYEELRAANNAR